MCVCKFKEKCIKWIEVIESYHIKCIKFQANSSFVKRNEWGTVLNFLLAQNNYWRKKTCKLNNPLDYKILSKLCKTEML